MNTKERFLIISMINSIESQLGALKTMLNISESSGETQTKTFNQDREESAYLSAEEERVLDKMIGGPIQEDSQELLNVPPIVRDAARPQDPVPQPQESFVKGDRMTGTLRPAMGETPMRSVADGMDREMSSFMSTISAQQHQGPLIPDSAE